MSSISRIALSNLDSLDEILLPVPFGPLSHPSQEALDTIEGNQIAFTPPPIVHHGAAIVALPPPFIHVLSSDHPVAEKRLWNVFQTAETFQELVNRFEGSQGRRHTGNVQAATIPYVESLTIYVESDDQTVNAMLLLVKGAGASGEVRIQDILDMLQVKCHSHLVAGGVEGLWWGGLRACARRNTAILTLQRGEMRSDSHVSGPASHHHSSARL